jgi:hypothetical protein
MYSRRRKPATEPRTIPATTPGARELSVLLYDVGTAVKELLESSF